MKVLVVDDDRDLIEVLRVVLTRAGLELIAAADPRLALRLLTDAAPDLVVLDINLSGWNGLDLLKEIRRKSEVPVIMLTARSLEGDKLVGFELGADDYVTKPFSQRELLARIQARLRRGGAVIAEAPRPPETLQIGPLALSPGEHRATRDGVPLDLTVTEYRLLHYLMVRAGTVARTGDVLRHVWGSADDVGSDVVRVTVFRLRRKIEYDPSTPRLLHTVPGVGVMLKPTE
jgi:DNA-binding response OmpR family regulator